MRLIGWMAALLLLLAPHHTAEAEGEARAEGAPAPRGCWTMAGGCPARTGMTLSPGIRGPLQKTWTFDPGSEGAVVEGEPCVWQDRVFVITRQAGRTRSLHVLSLFDGTPLAKPVAFKDASAQPLGVWNEQVLVQPAANELALYAMRRGRLRKTWSTKTEATIYWPIVFDDHVYANVGGAITCWSTTSRKPRWEAQGPFFGQLALRGGSVLGLRGDELGNLFAVPIDRQTGQHRKGEFIGPHITKSVPPVDYEALVTLHTLSVFIRWPRPVRGGSGGLFNTTVLNRIGFGTSADILQFRTLANYDRLPVETRKGWLSTFMDDKPRARALAQMWRDPENKDSSRVGILAKGERSSAWHAEQAPHAVAGNLAYIGARSVDLGNQEVFWQRPMELAERPVPVEGTLLLVDGSRTLSAWRARGASSGEGLFLGVAHAIGTEAATAALEFEKGIVLLVDGSTHDEAFSVAADGATWTLTRKVGRREIRKEHPTRSVVAAMDGEGRLIYTNTPSAPERSIARLIFVRRAEDYAKLAREAASANAPALTARILDAAEARGADEKRLAYPKRQLEAMLKRPRTLKERSRDKVLEKLKTWAEEDAAARENALVATLEDPRWTIQRRFIRTLLARGKDPKRAQELVKARIPAFLPKPASFKTADWIDLVDSLQHVEARMIPKPTSERDISRSEREYGSALHTWRQDLVALEAGDLLVLTPLKQPGRLAGCLAMGSLVTQALTKFFAGGEHVRKNVWPMPLHLFENKKTYQIKTDQRVRGGSKEAREALIENSAGHYSPSDGVSRIFLPERSDAWGSVMSTYTHELVHHWIEARCPLWKESEAASRSHTPGYWIVEGIATVFEEFDWDLEARTWSMDNPRAHSLDVVANAQPDQLLPWSALYEMPQDTFGRLRWKEDAHILVPMRWRLGWRSVTTPRRLFYEQSSATCHYLLSLGDKGHDALRAFVVAYYTGRMPGKGKAITSIMGISAEELGKRVVAFAKARSTRPN